MNWEFLDFFWVACNTCHTFICSLKTISYCSIFRQQYSFESTLSLYIYQAVLLILLILLNKNIGDPYIASNVTDQLECFLECLWLLFVKMLFVKIWLKWFYFRLQTGMRGAWGKPQGTVARVNIGQPIMSVRSREQNESAVIEALRRAKFKYPGRQKVSLSTLQLFCLLVVVRISIMMSSLKDQLIFLIINMTHFFL